MARRTQRPDSPVQHESASCPLCMGDLATLGQLGRLRSARRVACGNDPSRQMRVAQEGKADDRVVAR
jgi:hypothetical protein